MAFVLEGFVMFVRVKFPFFFERLIVCLLRRFVRNNVLERTITVVFR